MMKDIFFYGVMLVVLVIAFSSCTIAVTMQNGIERSSDLVDDTQTATADVTASVPVKPI